MKKIFALALLPVLFIACSKKRSADETVRGPGIVTYPATRTVDTTTNFFGTLVSDPYRWLEAGANEDSSVRNWVTDENKVTFTYLDSIPYREQFKKRLTELANYPKQTAPFRIGEYYFYTKNDGLQNQSVTYYKKGLNGDEKIFLDPNQLSEEGTVTQTFAGFSNDKKYAAISQSKAGSDWVDFYVKDIAANTMLKDKIEWTKFSGAAWQQDGFYYSGYGKPEDKTYTGKNDNQRVYFHKLGAPQSSDKLVYQDISNPDYYFGAQTTEDEHYLLINISPGTSGSEILCKDLRNPGGTFTMLCKGFDNEYTVIDDEGDNLIVQTNYNAPNYRVVLVDPKNPDPSNWKEIIAEQKETLETVTSAGGKLFAFYLRDVTPVVIQFSRDGKPERQVELPNNGVGGTISGFAGEKDDNVLFFSFTTFLSPADIYKYDIASGKIDLYEKSEIKLDASKYEMKQVKYKSKDGTEIPMFIVSKKGLALDGSHPCLLYGYGGFNISMKPSFSSSRLALLEQGFIYAMPNIRGGSEYGEEWHKAGMFEKKQNVFDDFIAAAEYLVNQKYTSSDKLAIIGRSNGGLLVGACMTQRPDLFKVALPGVGVLDMLRYHKFTIGYAWATEYGRSDDSTAFQYLMKYSPLQNIKKGTQYPATFITTGDHDDRVVPAHSFKFAATLQAAQTGENPVLIRIDTNAGHGAGKPITKIIDEDADWMSFTMWNVGIKKLDMDYIKP